MRTMRVIVCGGRDYDDPECVAMAIAALPPHAVVVHGDARGADRLAARAATARGLATEAFPADWARHGRSAGPKRNIAMLAAGADLVIAFPGGRGTAHMTTLARKVGVPVQEHR